MIHVHLLYYIYYISYNLMISQVNMRSKNVKEKIILYYIILKCFLLY